MENWIIEVVKILIGTIVGVFLTEAFPAIKTFFKKSSLSLRKRNIENIKHEYEQIKYYKKNHATLAVEILRKLTKCVLYVFLFITLVSVEFLVVLDGRSDVIAKNPAILGVFAGMIAAGFSDISSLIDKVRDFEKFRVKTIKDLRKLGGNPEDLDKEEAE